MNKRFIKINSIITLVAFVISLFSANIMMAAPACAQQANTDATAATEGTWNVKTPKGEFQAQGTGSYETWADGKQKFVLRDTLGHLMSWGDAKLEKLTDGHLKVNLTNSDQNFEATKVSNDKSNLLSQISVEKGAVTVDMDINAASQKAGALFDKAASAVQNKAAAVEVPATSNQVVEVSNASVPTQLDGAAAGKAAPAASLNQAPAAVETAAAPAVKMTLGQKLSALKTKVTTPIENGGKGSTAWDKGYNFGKDTPTNLVSKVKSIFNRGNNGSAAVAPAETAPASNASVQQAPASASNASSAPATQLSQQQAPAAQLNQQAAPAAVETAAAPAGKLTIGQKLSALKEKVTTPIEGGGKSSTAWEKGYKFGKETPTNVVDKVKSVFHKDGSTGTASSTPAAPETATSSNAGASAPEAQMSQQQASPAAPAAEGAAAPAAKSTLGQKLSALKEKVTTPIEGGGKGSEAWEKGYKFGKETPEKAVGKVKNIFKKDSASETAANDQQTPSQKLSDPKNSKVEFDEKTGKFEKSVQEKQDQVQQSVQKAPATPTKLGVALQAGKDTLKSSFSIRNLGLSAGLTVGFKIFEQVKNGEKVSIGKAVGYLATGEFAGSFVGSGLGSAAGAVAGSLIGSTIPVVGPILGALMPAIFGQVGGQIGSSLGNDLSSGQKLDFKKAIASIDKVAVLGQAVGSTIGAAIGSMIFPGIGSIVGGLVGSMIANVIINKVRNRSKSNYNVVGVNAMNKQIIFAEEVAPPPAASASISGGLSASGSGETQGTYEKMIAAYKTYSQLLSEGKGDSAECQQALSEYKQHYTAYANSMSQSK